MIAPQYPLEGKIKWFDVTKGYGFITPADESLPDIMLHINTLRRSNLEPPVPDGSAIVTEVEEEPNSHRWRASKVLSLDTSSAHAPLPRFPRTHVIVQPQGDAVKATVKWFNRLNGFGFLTRGPDTEDIFVHIETIKAGGLMIPQPGDEIMVRFGQGPKGLMAAEVQPINL